MASDHDQIISCLARMRTQLLKAHPSKLAAVVSDSLECALELEAFQTELVTALREISKTPCCPNSKYPGCRACSAEDVIAWANLHRLVND